MNKLKEMTISFWIVFVGFLIMLGILMWLIYGVNESYEEFNPEINYVGLNETEINDINLILREIDTFYFYSSKSITFYSDETFPEDYPLIGQNNNKDIIIRVRNSKDEQGLKILICHEILHNFSNNEEFVEKIEDKGLCYEKEN